MPTPVKISFLGGLGEIGRNCAVFEQDGRMLILDCGVMFPDQDLPGIDLVLPDFTYLRDNADRIDGLVLTHGHEDHTGAVGFLLREIPLTIYGSDLTLGLAANRVSEARATDRARFVVLADGERRRVGAFDIEAIPVTHSVPHGFAIALHTPQGVILHSGDFKIDPTPIDGRRTDLARIGSLAGAEGVRLLLSDSTNAEETGYTDSERNVGASLRTIFGRQAGRRIIVACFASHVHRIQQLLDAATATGRRVATLGRSMAKNVTLSSELGLLTLPEGGLIDIEDIHKFAPGEVCVISTGSQGEPMSALALLAAGENKWLQVERGDVVVLSSHAIPGNEWAVGQVIDGLARLGAEVVHSGVAYVHESGHAKQGELMTLLTVARPRSFVPVHGEYRHLLAHTGLAKQMGVPEDQVLLCEDGDVVTLDDDGLRRDGTVPAGYMFVDGLGVGDVGEGVLRDRRVLAEEGVVVVVVTVDSHTGEVVTGPEVITRGWVYAPEAEELLEDARAAVTAALEEARQAGTVDLDTLRRKVRRATGRFVNERTRRRPMIVPVVMQT
jgi:ribonuclease J